jgi:hypothetical protein
MRDSNLTKDHETIRAWAEARGGRPTHAEGTGGDPGILRLDFEPANTALTPLSWDEFFRKFDDADLSFLYQDRTMTGTISRFHRFVRA